VTLVVADASPLHYLILLGQQDLLQRLFESIVIPPKVAEELSRPTTPPAVRGWMQAPPPWLRIDARPLGPRLPRLDPGEADAIALALQIGADVLLIDEHRGRQEASRLGLRPVGVIGVLEEASLRNLVELEAALNQLVANTNFHVSSAVIENVLARDHDRRSRPPGPVR
jgi:predicted nucleic acid-binding protein